MDVTFCASLVFTFVGDVLEHAYKNNIENSEYFNHLFELQLFY